jgi:hypothetical protein
MIVFETMLDLYHSAPAAGPVKRVKTGNRASNVAFRTECWQNQPAQQGSLLAGTGGDRNAKMRSLIALLMPWFPQTNAENRNFCVTHPAAPPKLNPV